MTFDIARNPKDAWVNEKANAQDQYSSTDHHDIAWLKVKGRGKWSLHCRNDNVILFIE